MKRGPKDLLPNKRPEKQRRTRAPHHEGKAVELIRLINSNIAIDFSLYSAEDFTAQITAGSSKGMSALWLLADAAFADKPEALLAVLEQYKDTFKAEDFTTEAHKNISALWLLTEAASRVGPEGLLCILSHIYFDPETLKSISEELLSLDVLNLVNCRIKHVTLLEADCKDTKQLFKNAEEAQAAGYHEAYHDLGVYFEQLHMHEDAARAFLKMSEKSMHFQPVCMLLSITCIGEATNATSISEKLQHLKNAIKFSVGIDNDNQRHMTLRMAARIYIEIKSGDRLNSRFGCKIIPTYLLDSIHSQTSPERCFMAFDEISNKLSEERALRQENENQKNEIAKLRSELEKERASTQKLSSPQKNLLSSFSSLSITDDATNNPGQNMGIVAKRKFNRSHPGG